MTLRQKQSLFVRLVADLILHVYAQGYELTFGETIRSAQDAARLAAEGKGIAASLHSQRLAIDLNLFRDGRYLSGTESHRLFGEYWEGLHPLCRWGGRFQQQDGNHYSLEHDGRA